MSLVRNFKLEKILKRWKKESNCKHSIHYWYSRGKLTIVSSEVGYLIGPMGCLIEKYKEILKNNFYDFKEIAFQEVNYHWI